jgi:hypothetical protein
VSSQPKSETKGKERRIKNNVTQWGACWQDQTIDLKEMDVVYCNAELGPRIVIKQENGYDGKDSKEQLPEQRSQQLDSERLLGRPLRGTLIDDD